MIATTGSDAAVVYCTQFYMFAMRRVSHNKHTHSNWRDEGKRETLFSGSDSSSDAGTGRFIPHREAMMMFTWHRNTRPADDDSALRSLADYSACSSFDALFSTNTHLSFFLLFTAQHDSMFFRFFLYDSSRLY